MTEKLTLSLLHFSYVKDTVAGKLQRELNLKLCKNLEGWDGERDGRGVQTKGRHMYTNG